MITREKVKAHLKRRKIEYIAASTFLIGLGVGVAIHRKNKYLELLMEIIREYPFSTDDVGVIGTDRIGKLHQLMAEADDTLSKQSPFWDRHIK